MESLLCGGLPVLIIQRMLKKNPINNSSKQHDFIIHLLFYWLKTNMCMCVYTCVCIYIYVIPYFFSICQYLAIISDFYSLTFLPLGSGWCCCLCIWKWRADWLSCSPLTTQCPICFLSAKFIVRKISSEAAIACCIEVSFFLEKEAALLPPEGEC